MLEDFVGIQAAIDAVRDDSLPRFEGELLVIEKGVDLVGLEGDEVGDPGHLRPRVRV
jgi:hypothetical protein